MAPIIAPEILIRADASLRIGTGHIFRTLVLAGWLRDRGLRVAYAVRQLPGNLIERIRDHGFAAYELDDAGAPSDESWLEVTLETEIAAMNRLLDGFAGTPHWIVVDHFELDSTWERSVRRPGMRICAIDDLANRQHEVDAIVDSTIGSNDRYQALVGPGTRLFLGPAYVFVRDAFVAQRERPRKRDGGIHRIQIFYGGVDWSNESVKALEAVRGIAGNFAIDVVVGSTNPRRSEIEEAIAQDPRARLFGGDAEMPELTAAADLALGAAGSAMWERCFVGTPALLTSLMDVLVPYGRRLAACGAAVYLGGPEISRDTIAGAVSRLQARPEDLLAMSASAFELCAGYENARRTLLQFLSSGSSLDRV